MLSRFGNLNSLSKLLQLLIFWTCVTMAAVETQKIHLSFLKNFSPSNDSLHVENEPQGLHLRWDKVTHICCVTTVYSVIIKSDRFNWREERFILTHSFREVLCIMIGEVWLDSSVCSDRHMWRWSSYHRGPKSRKQAVTCREVGMTFKALS